MIKKLSEIQHKAETNFKGLEKKISQMRDQEGKTRILAHLTNYRQRYC